MMEAERSGYRSEQKSKRKEHSMCAVIQHDSVSLRQPSVTSTFRCLNTIVDTLRKIDPSEVSRGTLQCLQSNVLYVMASMRYSSLWSAEFKETILSYLEQGQKHLQEITQFDARRKEYSYFLEQCTSALINAVKWWRSLSLAYSIPLMLEEQAQVPYHLKKRRKMI